MLDDVDVDVEWCWIFCLFMGKLKYNFFVFRFELHKLVLLVFKDNWLSLAHLKKSFKSLFMYLFIFWVIFWRGAY